VVSSDQLIDECKQFNRLAQQLLYNKYAPAMKGLCYRYVNDWELVKDILQEGFIKVFSNIRQYEGKGPFESWIKRIFINTAISYLRKQKNNRYLNLDDITDQGITDALFEGTFDLNEPDQMGFDLVLSADLSEDDLIRVLFNIPEKYRLVFCLFCIENYSHEEIAELIEIDIITSRTRLMRARSLIKKELYKISIEKLGIHNASY
jgi:RNA polymerase sigma-70 factor (ECF subfamily)